MGIFIFSIFLPVYDWVFFLILFFLFFLFFLFLFCRFDLWDTCIALGLLRLFCIALDVGFNVLTD